MVLCLSGLWAPDWHIVMDASTGAGLRKDVGGRDGVGHLEVLAHDRLVLHVLADVRVIDHDGDAMLLQQIPPAEPGELEDLRRLQGAGRENDLHVGCDTSCFPVRRSVFTSSPRPHKHIHPRVVRNTVPLAQRDMDPSASSVDTRLVVVRQPYYIPRGPR